MEKRRDGLVSRAPTERQAMRQTEAVKEREAQESVKRLERRRRVHDPAYKTVETTKGERFVVPIKEDKP